MSRIKHLLNCIRNPSARLVNLSFALRYLFANVWSISIEIICNIGPTNANESSWGLVLSLKSFWIWAFHFISFFFIIANELIVSADWICWLIWLNSLNSTTSNVYNKEHTHTTHSNQYPNQMKRFITFLLKCQKLAKSIILLKRKHCAPKLGSLKFGWRCRSCDNRFKHSD